MERFEWIGWLVFGLVGYAIYGGIGASIGVVLFLIVTVVWRKIRGND